MPFYTFKCINCETVSEFALRMDEVFPVGQTGRVIPNTPRDVTHSGIFIPNKCKSCNGVDFLRVMPLKAPGIKWNFRRTSI